MVKLQLDLAVKLPEYVEVKVVNKKMNTNRIQIIKIQYDMLPKYCHNYKLQDHEES